MGQVENLLDRPKLYHNIDGVGELGELGMGFMLASGASILWLQLNSSANSIWNNTYLFLVFWGLVIAVIHYGSKAIKEHITYPRTGFVMYRKSDTVWLPMILGAVTAALGAAGLAIALRRHWTATSPAALFGLLFAVGYAYRIAKAAHWKWIVATGMACAALAITVFPARWLTVLAADSRASSLHVSGPHFMGALLFLFGADGLLFLVSGGISFWIYLRRTRPPAAEGQ